MADLREIDERYTRLEVVNPRRSTETRNEQKLRELDNVIAHFGIFDEASSVHQEMMGRLKKAQEPDALRNRNPRFWQPMDLSSERGKLKLIYLQHPELWGDYRKKSYEETLAGLVKKRDKLRGKVEKRSGVLTLKTLFRFG